MAGGSNSISRTFVWILLGLLIVGLAGFGATNLSGTIRTIGTVGNQTISVDAYVRELQNEMRAIEAQTRQPLTMEQARTLGLEQIAVSRLVGLAAIDHETAELGLSVGDENLQQEIVQIQAFHNINGQFDRETYRFALQQAGISESEFEEDLRAESARTLVQGAILSGVEMPAVMTDTLLEFIAARRSFTWARLDSASLAEPLPEPTEDALRAYYDANPDDFTLPETKRLTYALLSPAMILDTVEVDEAALRALYEERNAEFNQPERRLVERLVFADEAAASSAMAQLEVGGTTFDQLVTDRGLTLGDVDLGDVTLAELDAAGDAIFSGEINDVLGPLPSSLGPALFRINGVLAARSTPFEEAEPALRDELAADRARRQIETEAQAIDDLLAGGATLEEVVQETDMQLDQIDWTQDAFEGVAAYDGFRSAAAAITEEDFPEIGYLEDGSIFAMRLEEVLPPRPEPFDDARNRVIAGWTLGATEDALLAQASDAVSRLGNGEGFEAVGLLPQTEEALTRSAFIDGTPPGFMERVFETEPGQSDTVAGGGVVIVLRVDDALPPADTPETTALRDALVGQMDQTLGQAVFEAFARDARLRAQPMIDQRALNAVQASFQ